MEKPGISIIILTKNAGKLFQEVLAGLFACNRVDKAEVIMIDSGSTDSTIEYARNYPWIKLYQIRPEDFGHGRTRNFGARLAKGDILVYMVQDATPANPDFLINLLAPLANPQVAAAYGRQLPRPSTNPVERFFLHHTYPNNRQTRLYQGSGPLRIRSIFFSNVCSAIRRSVLKSYPFNENLIMSEDQQWARQVLLEDYSIVYEPSAKVYHAHNYELKRIFQRNFDSGCSLKNVVDDSLLQMMNYELSFLLTGMKTLNRERQAKWIPYFLLQEAVKSLGFFMGQHSSFFPQQVNRKLSLHKSYWDEK